VPPQRCLHALGLINIAIVVTYVSTMGLPHTRKAFMLSKESLATFLGILILPFVVLAWMNSVYRQFFTFFEITTAAVYIAFLIACLRHNWRRLLATALLLPAIATTALVNPLDRGLDAVLKSSLSAAIERRPELRKGRWLVYSSWIVLPGFMSAAGLDLANGLKIIPSLDELTLFDPERKFASIINQSCYLVAHVQTEAEPSQFESPQAGVVIWKVSPLDPRLKEMGIKYLAFDSLPDSSIRRHLRLLLEETANGIWAYELL